MSNHLVCPRCGSEDISVQVTQEARKMKLSTIILYVILALTIFGLLIVIPLLLRRKSETVTYVVCQSCGHSWKV